MADNAADLFRDFNNPFNPLSGAYEPEKPRLRAYFKDKEDRLESAEALLGAGTGSSNVVAQIGALRTDLDADRLLSTDKTTRVRAALTVPRKLASGFWFERGPFEAWAAFAIPTRTILRPARFSTWLPSLGGTDGEPSPIATLQLSILNRPAAQANAGQPFTDGLDTQILQQSYAVADLVQDPLTTNYGCQRVDMPLTGLPAFAPDRAYVFVLLAFSANGTPMHLGWAHGPDSSSSSQAVHGWVRTNGTWGGVGAPITLAYEIGESYGTAGDLTDKATLYRAEAAAAENAYWPGLTAVVPEVTVERAGASIVFPRRLLSFGRPSLATISDRIGLEYNYAQSLTHEDLSDVVVKRDSDGATLVLGVDYARDSELGYIIGIKNQPVVPVTVTYSAPRRRYDKIYGNPQTGEVAAATGTERGIDVAEFMPAIPLGMIELYTVLVTHSRGVHVLPTHQWTGLVPNARRAEHAAWLDYCRQRLPRLWRKARRGETIRLLVYSDSIGAQGGQSPADWYTFDGPSRDVRNGYLWAGRLGSDVVDAVALYDHGDGAGRVHTHIGMAWGLKAALEARFPCTVQVVNGGIGGTSSAATEPNGNFPRRLSAAIAQAPDVVLLGFGMNELGSPGTYAAMVSMIWTFRQAGAESLIMPLPLIPPQARFGLYEAWAFTSYALEQAGRDTDTAYVPAHFWADERGLLPIGVARRSTCTANAVNHPGPFELAFYRRLLAALVP